MPRGMCAVVSNLNNRGACITDGDINTMKTRENAFLQGTRHAELVAIDKMLAIEGSTAACKWGEYALSAPLLTLILFHAPGLISSILNGAMHRVYARAWVC